MGKFPTSIALHQKTKETRDESGSDVENCFQLDNILEKRESVTMKLLLLYWSRLKKQELTLTQKITRVFVAAGKRAVWEAGGPLVKILD